MEEKSKGKNFDELNLEELKEVNSQLKELNKRLEKMENCQMTTANNIVTIGNKTIELDKDVKNIKTKVNITFWFWAIIMIGWIIFFIFALAAGIFAEMFY